MKQLVLIIMLMFTLAPDVSARPLRACLKADSGKVVVRRKCPQKKGFIELNAEILQGLGATQVGPQGKTGPKGDRGEPGIQGPPGLSELEVVTFISEDISVPPSTAFGETVAAICPAGKQVVSGHCRTSDTRLVLYSSRMSAFENGWVCGWRNIAAVGYTADLEIASYCAFVE